MKLVVLYNAEEFYCKTVLSVFVMQFYLTTVLQ